MRVAEGRRGEARTVAAGDRTGAESEGSRRDRPEISEPGRAPLAQLLVGLGSPPAPARVQRQARQRPTSRASSTAPPFPAISGPARTPARSAPRSSSSTTTSTATPALAFIRRLWCTTARPPKSARRLVTLDAGYAAIPPSSATGTAPAQAAHRRLDQRPLRRRPHPTRVGSCLNRLDRSRVGTAARTHRPFLLEHGLRMVILTALTQP